MNKTACYHCQRRVLHCHDSCPDYNAYREERLAELDKKAHDNAVNMAIYYARRTRILKCLKRRHL
jgi:hypothetical protein